MEFSLQAVLSLSRLKPELQTKGPQTPLCPHGVQPSGCAAPEQARAWTPNL